MRIVDILGTIAGGVILISALAILFAPKSPLGQTIQDFGTAYVGVINAAKQYPTGGY